MKKAVVISFALLVLLAACYHKDEDGRNSNDRYYSMDPQTELCFASSGSHQLAHVPCTDKVKELIQKE
ncbi:hypothetical protein LCGC14_2680010 [marine sediment metagenome]|uniref:Lipoprotein n=1 Tax=marine sediment metagenome TaxID=412755 RepID=A0A0F9A984_9ZZZZ